jgi:hypothetical protein
LQNFKKEDTYLETVERRDQRPKYINKIMGGAQAGFIIAANRK